MKVHFVIRFDKDFERLDGWRDKERYSDIDTLQGSSIITRRRERRVELSRFTNFRCFGTLQSKKQGDKICVRTAISYVSVDNARENLENDAVTWDFDLVKKTSQDEWNKMVGTNRSQRRFAKTTYQILYGFMACTAWTT